MTVMNIVFLFFGFWFLLAFIGALMLGRFLSRVDQKAEEAFRKEAKERREFDKFVNREVHRIFKEIPEARREG